MSQMERPPWLIPMVLMGFWVVLGMAISMAIFGAKVEVLLGGTAAALAVAALIYVVEVSSENGGEVA